MDDGHNQHMFPPFSPERSNYFTHESTSNDLGYIDDVDSIPPTRPSNYYTADEIIARARMRVGGEGLSG